MIRYKVAGNEHFDELLEIIYHQNDPSLKPIFDIIQLTADHFVRLLRTNGVVYRIEVDGSLAGICWVETCGRALQLHSLIVREPLRNQGIGTSTLKWLEEHFRDQIDEIELRVHSSNSRAKALYERCGYQTTKFSGSSGFYVMQKKVGELVPLAGGRRIRKTARVTRSASRPQRNRSDSPLAWPFHKHAGPAHDRQRR
jgi:GNAT superfamily N-acetyltransferase